MPDTTRLAGTIETELRGLLTFRREPEDGRKLRIGSRSLFVEHPGLDVTGRAPASVGGLHGVQLDLALDAAWTKPCPFSEGLPAVPLVVRNSDFAGYHLTMVPELSMRWFLLPWKDGVILIDIDDSQGRMTREGLIAAATPIVESFVFSEADTS
jgi:hypothetical protein